jgi:hypothetical protein
MRRSARAIEIESGRRARDCRWDGIQQKEVAFSSSSDPTLATAPIHAQSLELKVYMCLRECLALHCMPTLRALAACACSEREPTPKSKNLFHPAAKPFMISSSSLALYMFSSSSRFFLFDRCLALR